MELNYTSRANAPDVYALRGARASVSFSGLLLSKDMSRVWVIMLGLKETFEKRHLVERASKAEIRPEEQSEKTENCWESLWNEM